MATAKFHSQRLAVKRSGLYTIEGVGTEETDRSEEVEQVHEEGGSDRCA
jgi:hypothetical protein